MKMKLALLAASLLLAWQAQAGVATGIDKQHFDSAVRAQDDIYHAVNGNWVKHAVLPASEDNDGAFKQLRDLSLERSRKLIESAAAQPGASPEAQKIGDLYHSFMDEAALNKLGLAPLRGELAEIAALKDKRALAAWMGSAQSLGVQQPLAFYVEADAKDARQYLAGLYQNGLSLPDRDYYLGKDARFEKARQAYRGYLLKLFKLGGYSEPERRAQRVFALETKLAEAQWSKVQNRDPQKTYNKMSVAELKKQAPGFDWQAFLDAAEAGGISAVNVNQPSYAQAWAKLAAEQPLQDWQDYLTVQTLDAYAPYLDDTLAQTRFDFHGKALAGTLEQQPRWKRGVKAVEGNLGEALGKLYVQAYFPPESKAKMEVLVGNLMKAYAQSIDTLSWMSPATKKAAQDKLSKYMLKIGYPNKWRDYGGLEIKRDDLAGNIKRGSIFEYRRMLARLGKPVDREEWGMTPQTVNAYYNPSLNEIVFPAAILQPPFFDAKADDAVNYGGIGAVIGHEISHGFDDQGSQFDGDGNMRNWWTAEDRARFDQLTGKLVAQYNAYEPLPGKHINGELTLGENIADNAGLQIAYKAYQLSLGGKSAPVLDGMNGDQRFFYGFAQVWRTKIRDEALLSRLVTDPHSPGEFRAIGAASNSDAFVETFEVKPGDKMFKPQDERIRIW
ncbi:peptidase M13 [Chromobacterium sp. LK1]|uniref:M13 family metallopeptidase n=1 Tax=Chromobacterium sp. LK1 TaxID=1628193 RepID=UPI000654A93D|nr:M13 family metallopeptidase [Chromobacterium sp. LK1]KMN30138.1 peptidase M13 [Chromobacterium sp. LK1]